MKRTLPDMEVLTISPAPSNILFIVFDQLRADALFGPLSQTVALPNLRSFMQDAVSFHEHYSVTSPCGPSRASLLTGQYTMNHGSVRNGTPLARDTPNLAIALRDGGIEPLLYGYTDTSPDPRHYAEDDPILTSYEEVMHGFTEAQEMRFDNNRVWEGYLQDLGYTFGAGKALYKPQGEAINSPALYEARHSDTAFLTDRLLEDLPRRKGPWCAHLTYIRPHPPFVAPAPYHSLVAPKDVPAAYHLPPDYTLHEFDDMARDYEQAKDVVVGFPDLHESAETTALIRAVYMGLVRELDDHIGRILHWLKEAGQYDETLIIMTADHGELLGDYGCWGKMHYYDAAYHVPLMIKPAGLPSALQGRIVTVPTESIDVTPTILDLMGIDVPRRMDGCSLRPWIYGQRAENWREFTISELDFGDPVNPTIAQTLGQFSAQECNLTILRKDHERLVHFAACAPQLYFETNGAGTLRFAHRSERQHDLTCAMLSHRMRNQRGAFAHMMITEKGAVNGCA